VTITGGKLYRDGLYKAYASGHAGSGDGPAAALANHRDLRLLLPLSSAGPVIDIGCGQGHLVRLLHDDHYEAYGVDVSSEQVAIAHAAGLDRVRHGDFRDILPGQRGQFAAVTATDLLEHLTKDEVLDTFGCVAAALMPGGRFVARVPNAVSPLGGHVRYGDFTHESSFTVRSVRQLVVAMGFRQVVVRPCLPAAHGLKSAAHAAAWKPVSAAYKISLAAETGRIGGHVVTQNLIFAARKADTDRG
jgi:2-polyprenyl-3-methyl-5-hydroxy-6-metoxy-1,4-benzoquinol methylase